MPPTILFAHDIVRQFRTRHSRGDPSSSRLDIQRDSPTIRLWPAVQLQYTFYQLVLTRKRLPHGCGDLDRNTRLPAAVVRGGGVETGCTAGHGGARKLT